MIIKCDRCGRLNTIVKKMYYGLDGVSSELDADLCDCGSD